MAHAMHKTISAASTNATSVKAVRSRLYGLQAMTIDETPVYLKLYNKASAPTVGTDTPVKVIMIPGNTSGAGVVAVGWPQGLLFDLGLAFALTTGIADSDSTAVSANEVTVNLDYE